MADVANDNPEEPADVANDNPEEPAAEAKASVKKGTITVFSVIALSLIWYLLADRFTPYTNQARVQGYVVGVAPKVAGVVTQVWVTNNKKVEEDQPLFQIDPSQYQIALLKAQSDLESARRQVDAGGAAVESARANLRAALANEQKAEKDTRRLERLYREDPGTISKRRLEISQATLDQARAGVTAAKADIRRAIEQKGGEDDKDNAILKAALSAVKKAKLDLANTKVTASTKGIITDLRAEVGQYAGTGSPVLTLISLNDVWINTDFTENNLGHLHPGSRVEILLDVLPGRVFNGEVRSIGLGVSTDQTQPPAGTLPTIQNNRDWLRQSQRFPVVIGFDVEQSQDLYEQLRIGGQASVIAYTEGHGILNFLGKIYIRLMSLFSYAY
ncbi:MAG: HlyD family secretion protein [Deltaproteobacteria bacterium]|nr:HlyD family secretion protein [Deltaproteobacteria bacterium]